MQRLVWIALLAMFLIPQAAGAIQLKWSNGADTLSFASATRAVLVLSTDSTETVLPQEWRIAWLADSIGITFVPEDSVESCDLDTAKVSAIDPPATPADSAAHLLTAHLCSETGPAATRATFVIDQPGGSSGRLRAVALDPEDPNEVIVSNEVIYNGGVAGEYAPVLLSASSTHPTALLEVTAIGWNLDSVTTMSVGAADSLWNVELTIGERSSTRIVGTAEVTAELPEALAEVRTAADAAGHAWLPAESFGVAFVSNTSIDTILFRDPNPRAGVYPKDFAFHYNSVYDPTDPAKPWKGVFHLFYIRNLAGQDSIIAHAWTDSLGKPWSVDTMAFRPSGQGWDAKRVWAPSIQQVGDLYYMFYTGVDASGNQSIGYATTPSLGRANISWTRSSQPAHTSFDTDWADQEGHEVEGVRAFRDPFVMPDPVFAGHYLLFNAGEDKDLFPKYAIGVARNKPGTLADWTDLGKYEATDHTHLPFPGAVESPMVVRDSLSGAWRMLVANAQYDALGHRSTMILTQSPGDSLTNRTASAWADTLALYLYLDQDVDVIGWQACEHLQIGQVHFFAAYQGDGIGITRMHWDPVGQRFVIAYPSIASAEVESRPGHRLRLLESSPAENRVRLAVESDVAASPDITILDATGRRVRRIARVEQASIRAEFLWDCHDESGRAVAPGLYFARARAAGRSAVVRVPLLR